MTLYMLFPALLCGAGDVLQAVQGRAGTSASSESTLGRAAEPSVQILTPGAAEPSRTSYDPQKRAQPQEPTVIPLR